MKCGNQRPCIRCIENKIGDSCKDSTKRILYDLGSSSLSFHPSTKTAPIHKKNQTQYVNISSTSPPNNQKCTNISSSISPSKKQRKTHNQQLPQIQEEPQVYTPKFETHQIQQIQQIQIPQILPTQQIQQIPIPHIQIQQQIEIPTSFLEDLLGQPPVLIENLEDLISLDLSTSEPVLDYSFYPSLLSPPSANSSPSATSSASSSPPHTPSSPSDAYHSSSPPSVYHSSSPLDAYHSSSPTSSSSSSSSSCLTIFPSSSPSYTSSSSSPSYTISSSSPSYTISSSSSPSLSSAHQSNVLDDFSSAIAMEMQEAEIRWNNANNMRNVLHQMRLGVEYPQVEVIITAFAELSIVSCNKSFAKMLAMPLDLFQNSQPQITPLAPAMQPRKSGWIMPSVITLQKAFKTADGKTKYCSVTICHKGRYSHSVVVSHESVSEGHAVPSNLRDVPIFGIQTITS